MSKTAHSPCFKCLYNHRKDSRWHKRLRDDGTVECTIDGVGNRVSESRGFMVITAMSPGEQCDRINDLQQMLRLEARVARAARDA